MRFQRGGEGQGGPSAERPALPAQPPCGRHKRELQGGRLPEVEGVEHRPDRQGEQKQRELPQTRVRSRHVPRPDQRRQQDSAPDRVCDRHGQGRKRRDQPGDQWWMDEGERRGDVVLTAWERRRQRAQRGNVVHARPPITQAGLGCDVKDPEVGVHRLPGKLNEPDDDVVDRGPGGDHGGRGEPQGRPQLAVIVSSHVWTSAPSGWSLT